MRLQIPTALIWTYVLVWSPGCCQTCSRDTCDDVSEEAAKPHQAQSMLQKNIWQQKLSMTLTAEDSCPSSCQSPECAPGSSKNGGMQLENGKCLAVCSKKYGNTRYCGSGDSYTKGDSVDCSVCLSGQYVHAWEGSSECPTGYTPLTDISECTAGLTIGGIEHSFASQGCSNEWLWPRSGCFSYGGKLYYSECSGDRPLSNAGHEGICKKVDTESQYVFAAVGSATCPSGRSPLSDLGVCVQGVTISGVHYTWNGAHVDHNGAHDSQCHGQWPAGPTCFAWGTKLYFSDCSSSGRPISTDGHLGICKRIVIPTSVSDAIGCTWRPENAYPTTDNSCETIMPDGTTRTGRCTPFGQAYGPALCSTYSPCSTAGAPCTADGFAGTCSDEFSFVANSQHVCDIWSSQKPITTTSTTTTTLTTTKAPSPTTCPTSCQSPQCAPGSSTNGGIPLQSGKCVAVCSKKYGNMRYCGSGDAYTKGDSIDCSPCASPYVFAAVGSAACPSGRSPVSSLTACQAGVTVSGVHYTWNGAQNSKCHWNWPAGPTCFAWGTKLYFSECGSSGKPISTDGHLGICKKVVIPTSVAAAVACTWRPENAYPDTDNSCETIMPDGTTKTGRCTPYGAAYGPARCSTHSSCLTVGAPCTADGFTGKCSDELTFFATMSHVCDIWSNA